MALRPSIWATQYCENFVSILVVVEYGLEDSGAQSEGAYGPDVSILVVVEYGLEESQQQAFSPPSIRFNPCCSGIWP